MFFLNDALNLCSAYFIYGFVTPDIGNVPSQNERKKTTGFLFHLAARNLLYAPSQGANFDLCYTSYGEQFVHTIQRIMYAGPGFRRCGAQLGTMSVGPGSKVCRIGCEAQLAYGRPWSHTHTHTHTLECVVVCT